MINIVINVKKVEGVTHPDLHYFDQSQRSFRSCELCLTHDRKYNHHNFHLDTSQVYHRHQIENAAGHIDGQPPIPLGIRSSQKAFGDPMA